MVANKYAIILQCIHNVTEDVIRCTFHVLFGWRRFFISNIQLNRTLAVERRNALQPLGWLHITCTSYKSNCMNSLSSLHAYPAYITYSYTHMGCCASPVTSPDWRCGCVHCACAIAFGYAHWKLVIRCQKVTEKRCNCPMHLSHWYAYDRSIREKPAGLHAILFWKIQYDCDNMSKAAICSGMWS